MSTRERMGIRAAAACLTLLCLASACTAEAAPRSSPSEQQGGVPTPAQSAPVSESGEMKENLTETEKTAETALVEVQEVGEGLVAVEDVRPTMEELRGQFHWLDVPEESACHDAVCYAAYREILQGVGEGCFAPEAPVTRAQVVTTLWRMSGGVKREYMAVFPDVDPDSWYVDGVTWGEESGVVTGTDQGTFLPDEPVTREQLAIMLLRYALYQELTVSHVTGDLSGYRDGADASEYARNALSWVLGSGIYNGMVTSDLIYPGIAVSRGQLAQVLTGFYAAYGDPLAREAMAEAGRTAVCLSAESHEAIQLAVDAAAQKYGAVGVQVAVVEAGHLTDTYEYGWATREQYVLTDGKSETLIEKGDPMTADHKIRIASISKVALGMACMGLAEEGTVDLDESIGTYWGVGVKNPYYPNVPVSIRSILSHTSSIFMAGDDVSRTYSSVKDRFVRSSGFSNVQPGSIYSWGYNNYAFGVLGMTLELAAGRVMDDILNERFFRLMDIDAAFESGSVKDTGKLATIYEHDGSVGRSVETAKGLTVNPTPGSVGWYFAGGLTASAKDVAKLVCVLANDGTYEGVRVLSADSVATMESILGAPYQQGFYQALPLRYQENMYGCQGLYYHTGSAYGVYNCMSYDPVTGNGVVVLTTGASARKDGKGVYAVCGEISQKIYEVIG